MSERIFYRAGYKYQLVADYLGTVPIHPSATIATEWITLTQGGMISIRKGYAWDGPSGPTVDTKSAMRGSLIHDALYQLIRFGHLGAALRETADQGYKDACIKDGMLSIRAWAHFKALRLFGGASAEPSVEKLILTAP